jgi:hypothetical protein
MMSTLEVSDEEAALLHSLLIDHLANLRELVYKTENHDWKLAYRRDEETVRSLLDRLGRRAAAAAEEVPPSGPPGGGRG